VVRESDAVSAAIAAQNALQMYEGQFAILQRDNAQLRERDAATTAKMRELYDVLEAPDGQNVEERVKGWKAQVEALQARVARLQIALGIGPNDDPARAAAALRKAGRLAATDAASGLPPYGHLLLMTALARLSPLLQSAYASAPTQLKTPTGDVWTVGVEEAPDADGAPMRLVVVREEPGAYAREEARTRLLQLESSLAAAIRENATAGKRLDAGRDANDPTLREAAEAARTDARTRGAEIHAEMDRLRPLAAERKANEWRFSADLNDFALKDDA